MLSLSYAMQLHGMESDNRQTTTPQNKVLYYKI